MDSSKKKGILTLLGWICKCVMEYSFTIFAGIGFILIFIPVLVPGVKEGIGYQLLNLMASIAMFIMSKFVSWLFGNYSLQRALNYFKGRTVK